MSENCTSWIGTFICRKWFHSFQTVLSGRPGRRLNGERHIAKKKLFSFGERCDAALCGGDDDDDDVDDISL